MAGTSMVTPMGARELKVTLVNGVSAAKPQPFMTPITTMMAKKADADLFTHLLFHKLEIIKSYFRHRSLR